MNHAPPADRAAALSGRLPRMPRPSASKRSRLCLLRPNGDIIGPDGVAADPAGAYMLVIARPLCRFHLFQSLPGVARARMDAAAELYAEAHAPYAASDWVLLRSPAGIGIWWWDSDRLETLLDGRTPYYRDRILPETVLQPPGEGWIQRCDGAGYEAQYWQDGALFASMWRRRAFTPEQWAGFAAGVPNPRVPPPGAPPEPQPVALPPVIGKLPARVRRRLGWRDFERAAAVVALLALCFGAYQQGQAMQYERMAAADLAEQERLIEVAESDAGRRHALRELAMTRAFASMSDGPRALTAAGDAFSVFGQYGFTLLDWSADESGFRARLSPAPELMQVREVASILENHPSFANVTARLDRVSQAVAIEAEIEDRGERPGPSRTALLQVEP